MGTYKGMKHHRALLVRFFSLVEIDNNTECWNWVGHCVPRKNGADEYGSFSPNGFKIPAHRWAYEYFRGQIPDGYQIHHKCLNTKCVNPYHLETVTPEEHGERTKEIHTKFKTHCSHGHEYNWENTIYRKDKTGRINKICLICKRLKDRERARNKPGVKHGCIGRPKGSKDSYQRKRTGYIARYANKQLS